MGKREYEREGMCLVQTNGRQNLHVRQFFLHESTHPLSDSCLTSPEYAL